MDCADIYSRFFSNGDDFYNDKKIELLKDCFDFAMDHADANAGLAVLSTAKGHVVAAYDFKRKFAASEYEGKMMSRCKEEYLRENVKCSRINILDGDRYFLNILSDEGMCDCVYDLIKNISRMIEGAFRMSNKHSAYGDMVLRALDNVSDAISYCDEKGHVRYANRACFEILGTTKDELFGKDLLNITTGKPMLLEILKGKKSIIDVEYFLGFRGKRFHFINSGYPVYSDEGDVTGAIDIFRSIERSRKLANDIAGYRAFFTFDDIICESKNMVELLDHAKLFARSDETILVLGESGTGKELAAQSIHNHSERRDGPFIALNCANFPNELIDSELFGYEEGAFTGAKKGGKQGKFELASGGTLFLDEIGEMQMHLQAKLLRVLETKCITRIGGNNQVNIDVRIVAATNRSLEKLVEEGQFRRDLYYRLKVLCLEIPTLRDRKDDIILLAKHFIRKMADKSGKGDINITNGAKKALLNCSWPGNVRELENAISRAVFICEGYEITEKTLYKAGVKESQYDEVINRSSIKINRDMLVEILRENGGNKKKTARILDISRPTLYKYLKKYNI